MKKLYIRYFDDRLSTMPLSSYVVLQGVIKGSTLGEAIGACTADIDSWMGQHPDGKVDFVWLF